MNWEVQVITDRGQIKTVKVQDYNQAQDAKAAALSMTGAKRVISAYPCDNDYGMNKGGSYSYCSSREINSNDVDSLATQKLLGNFTSSSEPSSPVTGALWLIVALFALCYSNPAAFFIILILVLLGVFLYKKLK